MPSVLNVHECELKVPAEQAGQLIDSLASDKDQLWPRNLWPPMVFDRPLGVGARGGHGPIRYFVENYRPGRSIRFRFTGPRGFDGFHGCEIEQSGERPLVLRHRLRMTTRGRAVLSWPVVYRPLHDALVEDAFTTARVSLRLTPKVEPWSWWVKTLRWALSAGEAPKQTLPVARHT